MQCIRWFAISLVGLFALAPTASHAQTAGARPSLDYFVGHQQLVVEPGTRERLDEIGGRLMWPLTPLAERWNSELLARTSVGGYLVHARPEDDRDSRLQYGLQADLLVGPRIARRVDPFVSLGVGTMETVQPERRVVSVPYLIPGVSPWPDQMELSRIPRFETILPAERERLLTVKPGIGAKINLGPSIDLRTDLYRAVDLRDGTQRGIEVSGGLSLRA